MRLPGVIDPVEFDEGYRLRPAEWLPAVAEVTQAHGLPASPLAPFPDGSNLVAAVADRWVAKIFPPFHRPQWESHRYSAPDAQIGIPAWRERAGSLEELGRLIWPPGA